MLTYFCYERPIITFQIVPRKQHLCSSWEGRLYTSTTPPPKEKAPPKGPRQDSSLFDWSLFDHVSGIFIKSKVHVANTWKSFRKIRNAITRLSVYRTTAIMARFYMTETAIRMLLCQAYAGRMLLTTFFFLAQIEKSAWKLASSCQFEVASFFKKNNPASLLTQETKKVPRVHQNKEAGVHWYRK